MGRKLCLSFTFRAEKLQERRGERKSFFFILKQLEMFPHFLPVLFKENFHLMKKKLCWTFSAVWDRWWVVERKFIMNFMVLLNVSFSCFKYIFHLKFIKTKTFRPRRRLINFPCQIPKTFLTWISTEYVTFLSFETGTNGNLRLVWESCCNPICFSADDMNH